MNRYKVKLSYPFDPNVSSYLYNNDIFVDGTTPFGEDVIIIETHYSEEQLLELMKKGTLFDIAEIYERML